MKNYWQTKDSDVLFQAILSLKNVSECEKFFRDVLTMKELQEMISRFKVARELSKSKPKSYIEIAKEVGTSTATVTRVAQWLKGTGGGYRIALNRLK
jgi:TrpR-related protein YerC/YecD